MSTGEEIKKLVLECEKKNEIVFMTIEGFASMDIDDFLKQPIEGILYDLNRLPEVVFGYLDDPKWVNDYAMIQIIRELKRQLDDKN